MSREATIDHNFNVEGTLQAQKISGRIENSDLNLDEAISVYKTLLESEGVIIYINTGLALGMGHNHVFFQIVSGSLQVRFGAADSWRTLTVGLAIHGDTINYMAVQATPDGGTGTVTYQLIVGKDA